MAIDTILKALCLLMMIVISSLINESEVLFLPMEDHTISLIYIAQRNDLLSRPGLLTVEHARRGGDIGNSIQKKWHPK
jgi:hypothetical protein